MAINPKAKLVLDRYQSLNTQRQTWEEHWQEVADYMMPRKADITKKRSKGYSNSCIRIIVSIITWNVN